MLLYHNILIIRLCLAFNCIQAPPLRWLYQ